MRFFIKPFAIVAAAVLAISLGYSTAGATNGKKVTICHNGHTITISKSALKGHFEHDGQPARGHEDDYLGECIVTPPTTEPPVEEPPVEEPPTEEPPVEEPPVEEPPTEEPPVTEPPVDEPQPPVSIDEPVVVEAPPAKAAAAPVEELPRTGTSTFVLAGIGASLIAFGTALRRRFG